MRHVFVFTWILFALPAAILSARETSPFRADSQSDAKKTTTPPDSRAKIIEELRTDFDGAVEKLNLQDPGRQTRAIQERILKNLGKLLEPDDDPPQNNNNSSSSNPPPKPMNPPGQTQNPAPKPTGNAPEPVGENKPTAPQPMPTVKPAETPSNASTRNSPPQTSAEPRQEKCPPSDGYWDPLPSRHRPAVDALSRERLPPRYEDLLREYYRALAESGWRE